MHATFPAGMEYEVGYDTTRYVKVAIQQVVISLMQAVGLVVLITFIFLGTGVPPWCLRWRFRYH